MRVAHSLLALLVVATTACGATAASPPPHTAALGTANESGPVGQTPAALQARSPQAASAVSRPRSRPARVDPGLPLRLVPATGSSGTTITIDVNAARPPALVTIRWQPWYFGDACHVQRDASRVLAVLPADEAGHVSVTFPTAQVDPRAQGIVFSATSSASSPVPPDFIAQSTCFTFDPVPAVGLFPVTGHVVSGDFLAFWQQHGGLSIFGYPLTGAEDQDGVIVQWFERARFEQADRAAAGESAVDLAPLGVEEAALRTGFDRLPFQPAQPLSRDECMFVPATQHNLCGPFRAYWTQAGGEALLGQPISEAFTEGGRLVQYCERARLEQRSDQQATSNDVVLGRLGAELLERYQGPPPGPVPPPLPRPGQSD